WQGFSPLPACCATPHHTTPHHTTPHHTTPPQNPVCSPNPPPAQRLAARLFHLDGFKKSQVAAFLRKNNDFSGMVAQEYLDFFQFGGQTLDQALRSFLQALVLTGETQERERILGHFSRRYHHCNPGAFPSPGETLTRTPTLLPQRLGRAMTSAEFVANLSGMMDGQDFPREQLKIWGCLSLGADMWGHLGSIGVPGLGGAIPRPTGAEQRGVSFLGRVSFGVQPCPQTSASLSAPWGRRGWKPFQAVLKGTVLYFLKPGGRTGEEGPEAEEPLGVHHALAERASKYTKRPNVFRLQTADWRVFLFQAPTSEEMFSWISRINLVAALFSSPPFPAAVGSQRRFVRPILPAAPSREEQHRSHEEWMERVAQELFEHQRNLPEKRGRARDLDEYRLKKEYLLYERRRYETYVQVLETWINAGAQDLEGWEAQAGPVVAPPDPPTLTKAHSSPSLVPEPPIAPTVRVKRNISERRTPPTPSHPATPVPKSSVGTF
uniref:Pleckstrin and Sec7 domain containing 4 n=1 Tax=Accipiter nisus TaxID=211598 RepID=A0A8B9NCS3_9AVES